MLNKITLMGRLTKDPELRRTLGGTAVTSFTLACDRDFKTEGKRETDFVSCVAFNTAAELASKYLSKGRLAAVVGRLQIRDWQDKEGNNRRASEIVVENVYFVDNKKDHEENTPPLTDIEDEGDIPF